MCITEKFLQNNREWYSQMATEHPDFFKKLGAGQSPEVLWIGCSDSRVPPEVITQAKPGEIFVHRNIANIVNTMDLNVVSVIYYAVEELQVTDIVVSGHYLCGGIKAAIDNKNSGLVDEWVVSVKDTYLKYEEKLSQISDERELWDTLVELNVKEQVLNIGKLPFIQAAWKRGRSLKIHGWVFNPATGELKDLGINLSKQEDLPAIYRYKD